MYQYDFSIIIPVYNTEYYIREAIESITNQTFPIARIQIIIVNDGSTDNTIRVLEQYINRYPNNIIVINKKNEGVSKARNIGVLQAKGKYVTFLDSDDKLEKHTLRSVYSYFERHNKETDVVVIPRRLFEKFNREHNLNYRFKKGTRIADLEKEPDCFHNAVSAAFIKNDIAKKIKFEEKLRYSEDTLYINKILLNKRKIGLLNKGCYFTRKRNSEINKSATQITNEDKRAYLDNIKFFSKELISYCNNELNEIPLFIQNVLLFELKYHLFVEHLNVLNKTQKQEYINSVKKVFQNIDDKLIICQRDIDSYYRYYFLLMKYGSYSLCECDNEICLSFREKINYILDDEECCLEFIKINGNKATFEGHFITVYLESQEIFVSTNGEQYKAQLIERGNHRYSLDSVVSKKVGFKVEIELSDKEGEILFFRKIQNKVIKTKQIIHGDFSPLTEKIKGSYYTNCKYTFKCSSNKIIYKKNDSFIINEFAFCFNLFKSNLLGSKKAIVTRLFAIAHRRKNRIWIFSDRINKADDNGQALFEYACKNKKYKIKYYFALDKKAQDKKEIRAIGKTVDPNSRMYKLLFLSSEIITSSQADSLTINPFGDRNIFYKDLMSKHDFVYLQHGVIKEDLSRLLNRYSKNQKGFITVTTQETNSIIHNKNYYLKDELWLTGFPRYDKLYNNNKQYITIMPTWRRNLVGDLDNRTGLREAKDNFVESKYYKHYSSLLNNKELIDYLENRNYQMRFMCHPNMVNTMKYLTADKRIRILNNEKYNKVFSETSLLITDYSSIDFDYAYLRKPLLYYHFDIDTFFENHSYSKGYFDYEKNGFGNVAYTEIELVDLIKKHVKNNCVIGKKYANRINKTFPYNDKNNCERVFNKIFDLLTNKK